MFCLNVSTEFYLVYLASFVLRTASYIPIMCSQHSRVPEPELSYGGKMLLKSLKFNELGLLLESVGCKRERASDLSRWLYGEKLIQDLSEITDDRESRYNFKKTTIEKLSAVATADGELNLNSTKTSNDGTIKLVSTICNGKEFGGLVETVLIPMLQGPQQKLRYTICVSSQVGCAMNCRFCHTGQMGLMSNLKAAQIVEQVIIAKRYLVGIGCDIPIRGVVFMGMGEPFDNYNSVKQALLVLTEKIGPGLRISAGRVTVSTVGIIPRIREYCEDQSIRAHLAVSLHATEDLTRDWIVPVNKRYKLGDLMETLADYFPRNRHAQSTSTISRGRMLVLQYTLLDGVNDTTDDAKRLADMASRLNCVVNLIMFNDHPGTPFRRSSSVEVFRNIVTDSGILCTIRTSKGSDNGSACGQLGSVGVSRRKEEHHNLSLQ